MLCLRLPCLSHTHPTASDNCSEFLTSSRGTTTFSLNISERHASALLQHIRPSLSSNLSDDFRSSGPVHGNERVFDRYMQPHHRYEGRKTRAKLSAEDKRRYAMRRHLGACPRHKVMKKKVSTPSQPFPQRLPRISATARKVKSLHQHLSVPLSYPTPRVSWF